ncbi:MAG TPA: flagellar motor switch protein FliN [Candidatus Acidoferrales bacterium]|nr:flagellar motor switch protein FliN [Candidatus Acidoferrales bacterium]
MGQRSAADPVQLAEDAGGEDTLIGGEETARGAVSLDRLLDVPVTLSIEVGRSRLSIREVLALHEGAVVTLDRHAGEPLGVFVNGALVARGEVVIVNDTFGIRLTEVVSPTERMGKAK